MAEIGPPANHPEAACLRMGLDLAYTCDIFHQIVACNLAAFGLSRSTFNILVLLHYGPPEGMQLHELGELLLVSRANITGLIDHLEQKRLVTRVVDAADRRARFAKITRTGSELVEEVSPAHNEAVRLLFDETSAEERQSLIRLLGKVRASLLAGKAKVRGQVGCRDESNHGKNEINGKNGSQ